jgi:hypothetical protein
MSWRCEIVIGVPRHRSTKIDEIYVTVGTGQAFEFPVVQCFISKGQESKAANLSRRKQITVRGQVDGLLMNVLLKDCEINWAQT